MPCFFGIPIFKSFSKDKLQQKIHDLHFWLKVLIFPFLHLLAPLLMILIKVVATFRPTNKFVVSQKKLASLGESAFEATPQLFLQIKIAFDFESPVSKLQIVSIISSAMALSFPNCEIFIENQRSSSSSSFVLILKYFPVFFSNMAFRILAISIGVILLRFLILAVLGVYWILLGTLAQTIFRPGLNADFLECTILSFVTVSNIQNRPNSEAQQRFRCLGFYFTLIIYTALLLIFGIICNVSPESIFIPGVTGNSLYWDMIPLVKVSLPIHHVFGRYYTKDLLAGYFPI